MGCLSPLAGCGNRCYPQRCVQHTLLPLKARGSAWPPRGAAPWEGGSGAAPRPGVQREPRRLRPSPALPPWQGFPVALRVGGENNGAAASDVSPAFLCHVRMFGDACRNLEWQVTIYKK